MKISHLQENLTPASAPSAPVPGPKFGRSDEMLESDTGSSASTTAGTIAPRTGEQRKGKKSIFQGIKNAGGFANSRKAGIGEGAINEDDLSEENLLAKQRQEEFRFKRSTDRDIGDKPKSREIMAKETKKMALGPDNVSTSGVDYSLTGNDSDKFKFDAGRNTLVPKDSSNSTPVSATPKPGSWQEIAALNKISDPRKLQANSRIELPNGESMYVNPGDTLSNIAKRLSSPAGDPQLGAPGSSKVIAKQTNAASQKTAPAATGYHDPVYDYKPEVSTSSSNTIHPPGTSITAKIRDPKAPSWPLDVNLTKDADGNWRNEKGQVHNFRVPGDKEQLEKMPALPPNQSSAETKRLNSIPKNKEPDIHSQAARDAQWEKDKENMGKVWDEFKGWVKKPRSFTIVPGKGKPAFDPDPTHAVGRQIIPSNGQNIGLWPDELVDRYKSMTGAKDDAKSKDDTKFKDDTKSKQKSTTDKTSFVDPKLSTYHKVIAGIESGNRNFDKKGNPVASPKGAKFAMQVMPKTNKDPGFGVVPAKDDSPAESNRVGRDYFDAMMKKYNGDTQKATAAYNAGPGKVDSKIAKAEQNGKDWRNLLPRETRNYLKKFNKGIEVASNNDSMNEDISQKYARDYEYILEYLLSEGRIMTSQEKSEFNSQADYGGEDPDARDVKGNLTRSTSPGLGGSIDIGGVDIPSDVVDAGLGSMGAMAAMGSMKIGGGLRPGLQKQQAQQKTTAEFDKFLKGGSGTVFNPQTKINTSATPKVMRGRNDPGFDPNLSTKGTMTGLTSPVDAKVKPDSAVSTYNPKTKTWSPGPDPAIKSSNVNAKPVNTTPKYDPKLDASNYNARGDYVGPSGTNTTADKGKTNTAGNLRPGKQKIKDKEDREEAQRKNPDNWFKSQADPGLPFKPIPPKFDTTTGKKIDPLNGLPNFYYESTISRIGDEYEQILESMINKLSLSEERTETKNEKGEVTSWRDESDWRKVKKVKDGRGRVTNLSDKARRETEKLTDPGAKEFEKEVHKNEPGGEKGRLKNLAGASKALPADAFGRTSGKIPASAKPTKKHDPFKGLEEEKSGLWANIHAKQNRIKNGSGEKMRKPGSKGAPTADALRKSAK